MINVPSTTGTNKKVPKNPPALMSLLIVPRVAASTVLRHAKESFAVVHLKRKNEHSIAQEAITNERTALEKRLRNRVTLKQSVEKLYQLDI